MKQGLFILFAVVLAPVLLVGLVALAAGDWRTVGTTAGGDQVLVSSVTSQKNGLRTAWVRVEYKEPIKLPQGGPYVELRARVRFNCASGSAVPSAEWFYSRDRGGSSWSARRPGTTISSGRRPKGISAGSLESSFVSRSEKSSCQWSVVSDQ